MFTNAVREVSWPETRKMDGSVIDGDGNEVDVQTVNSVATVTAAIPRMPRSTIRCGTTNGKPRIVSTFHFY